MEHIYKNLTHTVTKPNEKHNSCKQIVWKWQRQIRWLGKGTKMSGLLMFKQNELTELLSHRNPSNLCSFLLSQVMHSYLRVACNYAFYKRKDVVAVRSGVKHMTIKICKRSATNFSENSSGDNQKHFSVSCYTIRPRYDQ